MNEDARKIFEGFAERGDAPKLRGFSGTFRFDIADLGSYRVKVDDGRLDVKQSRGDADCTIACDADDFVRLMRGEQNMVTAMMQGRVAIGGDPMMAVKFAGVLPAPASQAEKKRRAA